MLMLFTFFLLAGNYCNEPFFPACLVSLRCQKKVVVGITLGHDYKEGGW